MDFEQMVIYVVVLMIVTVIAIHFGVFVSGQDIAITLIVGWAISAWQNF